MTNFRKTVFSTLLVSLVTLTGIANAETVATPPEANQTQKPYAKSFNHQQRIEEFNKATISAADAIKTAISKIDGDVILVRFGTSSGQGYYLVEIFKDNKPEQVYIDAKTGEVIIYKIADDHPQMKAHYHKGKHRHQAKHHKGDRKSKREFPTKSEFKKPEVSVSLSQAIDTAIKQSGGKVVTARLAVLAKKDENAAAAYHIFTVNGDKHFLTVIDAKTGEAKDAKEFGKPQAPKTPEEPKPADAP